MIKLVDYFVVVGYDDSECNNNSNRHKAKGKIVQRFPIGPTLTTNNNNTDVTDQQHQILEEFDANIHCFCQPDKGWRLYTKQEPPTFFVSVLTDIKGQHRYCACLTFLEPYTPSKQKSILNNENNNINGNNCNYKHHHNLDSTDEDIKDDSNTVYIEYLNDDFSHANIKTTLLLKQQPNNSHKNNESTRQQQQPIEPSKLYVAKSLVLISRLEYIDLFKSCLSLIYAVYVDKRHSTDNKLLEIIISNLLTLQVNAPGTALGTTFSLGADDKHIVQATASLTVPSTGASVYKLFKEIGIVNVFKLVLAILADFKILFFSRSYTKLYDACRAIESLLFPLKYTGVYVPVLPCFGSFLEFPAAPTPYIIGVHSSFRRLIEEMHSDCLQECLKVDLDGANVWIPQCVDDLIGGNFNSSNTHQSSNSNTNSSTGTNTTSGISMMTGSSSSAYSESYSNENNNNNSNSNKTFGLPNYLYESTLNLLYSILKPDVLRADELVEFSQKSNTSNVSSMWSMSSGIVSSSSTSSLDQKQHQNQQHENDQLLFVSQLNSNTAAQMLVAAAANDLQTVF
jgi:myotubularin-related protein 5/13